MQDTEQLPDWLATDSCEDYQVRDKILWQDLTRTIGEARLSTCDILQYFPAYIRRRDLPRLLAQFELFNMVVDLPGSIIDLGIGKGSSFFTWSNLLETFCSSDRTRRVFGFDEFNEADAYFVEQLVDLHNRDNLLPNVERCHLLKGPIANTIPSFVENNPGLRISLLHLDLGQYELTQLALTHLYPLMVPGAVLVIANYGQSTHSEETKAIDEYFAQHKIAADIRKFPYASTPHGYTICE